jgi:hypothetical protein
MSQERLALERTGRPFVSPDVLPLEISVPKTMKSTRRQAAPSKGQRVYHFVEPAFGIDDLRRRRLKIAELNKLNDPFEFLGVNLSNPDLRRSFRVMKDEMAKKRGLLCFSRSWRNPVQWSHYAAKHTGLCLGRTSSLGH